MSSAPSVRPGEDDARRAWRHAFGFLFGIVALSALLSFLIVPWVDFPWWRVFRRCASVAAVIMLAVMVPRSGRSLRSLGLVPWREGKRALRTGLLLGFAIPALLLAAYVALGVCRVELHQDTARVWRTTLGFVPAAGLVALLEETVFRGYLFRLLTSASGLLAWLVSSLGYALVHWRPHVSVNPNLLEMVGLTILGGVLTAAAVRTNHLYLGIGLHASLAYWARVNKLYVQFVPTSSSWWTGDNRLINSAVTWVALIILGLAIWGWVRHEYNVEELA